MAVTGAIFNSLVFGGVNSADYGIYITGEAVFNAPKRAVETVSVPGRNGDIIIDQGRWENIDVKYPAGTFGMNETQFKTALSNFRNAIVSQLGYQRLSDTYHPEEYRMGVYAEGLEVDTKNHNKAGEFDLKFNCKPQRWLTAGEVPVTIGEWGATQEASGEIVTIESEGGEAAKSLEVSLEPIQDLNGYDAPWVGGAGKNKLDTSNMSTATASGVTFSRASDGTITVGGKANTTVFRTIGSIQTENGVQYTITGTPSGGASGKYRMTVVGYGYDNGSGYTFTGDGNSHDISVDIYTGYPSSGTLTFKPMIRPASVSDATYEPYTNICPISGRTEVVTHRVGKNFIPYPYRDMSKTVNGITSVVNDDGSVVLNGTATAQAFLNFCLEQEKIQFEKGSYILSSGTTLPSGVKIYANVRVGSSNLYGVSVDSNREATMNAQQSGYLRCYIDITSGTTVNNLTIKPMLRLATDVDDTYEPYQGNTYTTDLGRTVYGGTLDVVSGELVVDRAMVDLGTLSWIYDSAVPRFYSSGIASVAKGAPASNKKANIICSAYKTLALDGSEDSIYGSEGNGGIALSTSVSLSVKDTSYTNATAFKTAVTGQQLVYELAEPQTYQLTPQQIELLLGENHVWSDGSITMQYGDDPDSLWNPTLYESHPLLMVEGYGGLRFGENRFYLRSATYGDVELIDEQTLDLSRNNSYTFELPSYKYQAGDTITVEPFVAKFRVYDKSGQVRNMTATTTSGPATVTIGGGNTRVLVNVAFDGTIPLTFTAGTTKSYTEDITLVYTNSAGSRPRVTANITILYNSADETITISSEFTTPRSAVIYAEDTEFNGITADSTATVIGEVTYIDCELGEAYKIENGKLLPVSYYLTMTPAKPALIPGDNEITITSDTITGLSIIPRWWQL